LPNGHFAARAKRVIFLFQSGAPSQMDLFDYKPLLNEMHGQELPAEVRGEQRLTGMSGNQSSLPLVGSPFEFSQHGASGAWFSELLPKTAGIADDLCLIHSPAHGGDQSRAGRDTHANRFPVAGTADDRCVVELRSRQ
jgi:hypothetical protein